MIGWVHRIGQIVRGIGQDFGSTFGKFIGFLAVDFGRIRGNGNASTRILHRASDLTFTANKAQNAVIIAIQRRQSGLIILLRPHALIPLNQAIEDQIFHITGLFLPVGEPAR